MTQHHEADSKIDHLLDAIEHLREDRREDALHLLRQLVHEYNDFEEAWLWMSVAVESLDLSSICLDNVLRVNPDNAYAAAALHRIREQEMMMEKRRTHLSFYRDFSWLVMWLLVVGLLYGMLFAYFR